MDIFATKGQGKNRTQVTQGHNEQDSSIKIHGDIRTQQENYTLTCSIRIYWNKCTFKKCRDRRTNEHTSTQWIGMDTVTIVDLTTIIGLITRLHWPSDTIR